GGLMFRILCTLFLLAALAVAQQPASAKPAAPGSAADLVQQGQKLSHEGKQDEALALYSKALDKSPGLYDAHLEMGIALDLKGDYAAAHEHFAQAIELAPTDRKSTRLNSSHSQ